MSDTLAKSNLGIDPDTLKTRVRFIERDSDFYKLARALEYQKVVHRDSSC